jgi:PAS domain S-box-containing protein
MKELHKKDAELAKARQRRIAELERKAALQQKVGELNARLAAIVEHSSDAITGKDLNGIITSWNKGAEIIYGYTAEEAIGHPISMLVPPGNSDEIPRILDKIRREEDIEDYETIRMRKDGRKVYVSLSISSIKNFRGEIIGASIIARDITKRKQADEQIKLAKEEWEQTFDAMPDIVAVIDVKHVIRRANKALANRLGLERDELIGKPCYTTMCGIERPRPNCPGSMAVLDGKEQIEERFVDNLKGYYLISCTPIKACDGSITCFVEVCRDITDRKRVEEALHENESRLQTILENSTEWIWEIDLSGRHKYSNNIILDILGYSADEFVGRDYSNFIHEDDLLQVKQTLPKLIAEKRGWKGWVLRWRHKDGSYYYLESNAKPIINTSGEIIGFRGADRDITERRKSEEALRKSEEKFRTLVETTSDWIWEVDEKAIYTYVSPKVRNILGYKPEEILGKTPFDLMPHEEASRVTSQFQSIIANREHFSELENINRHKDGRLIVLETSGVPVFNAKGIFCGYRGIDRNITERKKLEQERERLFAELKESIANVKTLRGMLPICANCKKIRDDKGYWQEVASYITLHSGVLFTHGLCPACAERTLKELKGSAEGPD